MGYNVDLQTNYPNTAYNWKGGSGKTIYLSGCCPASVRNILVNLCGTKTTIKDMCALAISCGARVNGGTVPGMLLSAAKSKYDGFTYQYTTSDSKARTHAASGGMCLCHTTGSNKVFSNSGHFVAMVKASGNCVTIIDPFITSKKWALYDRPKLVNTDTGQTGVVTVTKATSDASFNYYYLITKVADKTTERNTDDMTETEVRKIIDQVAEEKAKKAVSSWAKDAFAAATKAGILDGTMPQGPVTREQLAQVFVNAGLIGGSDTPSAWAADAFQAATDAGVLDGSNPHGYVTREMLAQVLRNLSLIGTGGISVKSKEVGG